MSKFSELVGGKAPSTSTPTRSTGRSRFSQLVNTQPEPINAGPYEGVRRIGEAVVNAIPQPIKTTVGTVLDYLGRPGAATAGAVNALQTGDSVIDRVTANLTGKRRDDFDQVLEDAGAEENFGRHVAGFVGDVVLDPLNLVGVGAVSKLAKAAKLDTVAAKAAATVARHTPEAVKTVATGVKDALGEKFVPRYGLKLKPEDIAALESHGRAVTRDSVADVHRMFQKERSTVPARVEQSIVDRYKGTDEQFRKDVLEGMDAGAGRTDDIDTAVLKQKKINDDLFNREVAAGVQKPEAFNPDYAPFDFSRTRGEQAKALTSENSAINAKLKFAKRRGDPERTLTEAVAKGAEPDVALAQLTREIQGNRAAVSGEHIQDLAGKFGLHAETDSIPDSWEALSSLTNIPEPLKAKVEDVFLPSYIVKHLKSTFEKPKEATMLGKIYDKAMQGWRLQATVLRPGFHLTNLQGNMFNGALLTSTVNPKRFLEAATWGRIKNASDAPKMGKYSVQEVSDFMDRFGVAGAGSGFTSELLEEGADKTLMHRLAGGGDLSHNPLKHPARAAQFVGSTFEDFSKRALFFDQLHKGAKLEDAMKTVDKFLFDYKDLTDFEKKYMRRIFPFYTWMRKNVPLQAEQVVKQPHKYALVGKAQQAMENATADAGVRVPDGERADYLQENNAVQIPTGKGQPKKFLTPYLPYGDLNKIPIPGGSDGLSASRDVLAGANPLLKAITELSMNKSLFFNKPVYDEDLGPVDDLQPVNAYFNLLPESVKRQLFTEVKGKSGPEFQMPAIARYLTQMAVPAVESVGKSAQSIFTPEDSPNPSNWMGNTLGLRVTERNAKQEAADRKAARNERKRTNTKKKNQRPISKSKLQELYDRYSQE